MRRSCSSAVDRNEILASRSLVEFDLRREPKASIWDYILKDCFSENTKTVKIVCLLTSFCYRFSKLLSEFLKAQKRPVVITRSNLYVLTCSWCGIDFVRQYFGLTVSKTDCFWYVCISSYSIRIREMLEVGGNIRRVPNGFSVFIGRCRKPEMARVLILSKMFQF